MVVEAEDIIDRIVKTIETTPRESLTSKFGIYGDKSEIAGAKLLYANTATLLAEQGDKRASLKRLEWATLAYNEIPEAAFLVKVQALPTLIRAYVKSGNKEGARRILTKRVPHTKSAFQKSSVATLFIHAGDFESAMHLSKRLGSDPTTGHSLGRIASSFIQAGEFAAAKDLLATLSPTSDDQEAYRVAARGMVDGGQIAELKQWLPEMPSPAARVYACQGAINGLVQ
jgi:thioredoxin-like negative regulator of GroEL